MFLDMGHTDVSEIDAMATRYGPWLSRKMEAGEYLGWLVVTSENRVAAGTGLWLMDWPPDVIGSGPRRGNILNVYTAREFRRRGLARVLMETAAAWCRENGVDIVILHASPEGRALYDSMGFAASNEMRMRL